VAKLPIGSKKLEGFKNGTDLLYHHAKYDDDRGSRTRALAVDKKSVMFLLPAGLFLLSGPYMGFSLRRGDTLPR